MILNILDEVIKEKYIIEQIGQSFVSYSGLYFLRKLVKNQFGQNDTIKCHKEVSLFNVMVNDTLGPRVHNDLGFPQLIQELHLVLVRRLTEGRR